MSLYNDFQWSILEEQVYIKSCIDKLKTPVYSTKAGQDCFLHDCRYYFEGCS